MAGLISVVPIFAVIDAIPQLSVAVGEPKFTVVLQSPEPLALVLAVLLAGHKVIIGFSLSVIVTV